MKAHLPDPIREMRRATMTPNDEANRDAGNPIGGKNMKSQGWTKYQVNRRAFIGGSDARIVMGDDENALLRLWREKRGEIEPEDLSSNLVVQLGTATEHFNRQWY